MAPDLRVSGSSGATLETIASIFELRAAGELAFADLAKSDFDRENLLLLTADGAAEKIDSIPSDEGEQPGMGSAIGGVVGGAVGLAAGAVLSNLVLPGVGPILTLTLSAGGGLGGAAIGATGGSAAERALSNGLPKDEVFFYEDALRRCRTLVIAMADSDAAADAARSIMERNGAESVDAAREKWWIGIRDVEATLYGSAQEDFAAKEKTYRAGFEAALEPEQRDQAFEAAEGDLRRRYPNLCAEEAFRRGYERGRAHLQSIRHQREGVQL